MGCVCVPGRPVTAGWRLAAAAALPAHALRSCVSAFGGSGLRVCRYEGLLVAHVALVLVGLGEFALASAQASCLAVPGHKGTVDGRKVAPLVAVAFVA